jgi:protein ImuA
VVETAHRKETLWAMEEALRSAAPAAVVGVIDQLDLKLSQRLHLAAIACGLPLLLLRPPSPSQPFRASGRGPEGGIEASAAATRWRVGTAAAARDRFGLIARPRWRLHLERCRNGRPGEWIVEYDHVAHRFSLAAALADPALSRRAGESTNPKSRCA